MGTITVTRVVHSSVLIDFDGTKVLTDPWFSERFGYYHGEPYGITLKNLPRLDGVVVSHGHYDHYDMQAFRAYPDKQVPLAVKRGIAKTALKVGFTNVIEMDAWDELWPCHCNGCARQTWCPRDHISAASWWRYGLFRRRHSPDS
jgi:L-ascorbate metabolism protein UlaG (beta-lactamase superfamily)